MGLGIFASLLPGVRDDELRATALPVGAPVGPTPELESPWSRPNHLASVVFSDIFGVDPASLPLDRAAAMRVPAAARARHIIAGTAAEVPLRAYSRAEVRLAELEERPPVALDTQPGWIDSTSGALSPFHRMLWTADDLLWYGWSCWSRTNSAPDPATQRVFPLQMDRIPMGRWSLDDAGRVKVDRGDGTHVLVDQATVCLIPGPHEGLLTFAQDALRHARDLQAAAVRAAETPAAHVVLQQTAGEPLLYENDDPNKVSISSLLRDWRAARKREGGGVGYVPLGLEAKELGTFSAHLLESGRNAAAVDIARDASLPADLLDAAGESSLTYTNARDNDNRAVQWGLGLYLSSISAALSQDSVTPRGQVLRFAIESWLEDPTPAPVPATPQQQSTPPTPPEATAT